MTATRSDADTPGQLCRACLAVLPVQRVSIMVSSAAGVHEFLSASDEVAERLEWAQITLGEGPGWDADADPVVVHDAADVAARWPAFAEEAAAVGVSYICAIPLQLGKIRVGVLSLYPTSRAGFDDRDVDDAVTTAHLITSILISGSTTAAQDRLNHWWDQPRIASEIQQATGMLMARLGVDATEAHVRLQAYAFAQGRLLGDVASDVVHDGLRIDQDPENPG